MNSLECQRGLNHKKPPIKGNYHLLFSSLMFAYTKPPVKKYLFEQKYNHIHSVNTIIFDTATEILQRQTIHIVTLKYKKERHKKLVVHSFTGGPFGKIYQVFKPLCLLLTYQINLRNASSNQDYTLILYTVMFLTNDFNNFMSSTPLATTHTAANSQIQDPTAVTQHVYPFLRSPLYLKVLHKLQKFQQFHCCQTIKDISRF